MDSLENDSLENDSLENVGFELAPEDDMQKPAKTLKKRKPKKRVSLEKALLEAAQNPELTALTGKALSRDESLGLIERQLQRPDISPELFAKLMHLSAELRGWRKREVTYRGVTGRKNRKKEREGDMPSSSLAISPEMAEVIRREKESSPEEKEERRRKVQRLTEADNAWIAAHPGCGYISYDDKSQQERLDWYEREQNERRTA